MIRVDSGKLSAMRNAFWSRRGSDAVGRSFGRGIELEPEDLKTEVGSPAVSISDGLHPKQDELLYFPD